MAEWAFLILLTFAAATDIGGKDHIEQKRVMCVDAHCVGKVEREARESTTLTRFRVFERRSHGINDVSGASAFPPIIDWMPL